MSDVQDVQEKIQFVDLSEFYDDKDFGDITFVFKFGEGDDGLKKEADVQRIKCHLAILGRRCPSLVKISDESLNGENEIEINGLTYTVFKAFTYYLYSGRVDCDEFSVNELIDLYEMAEKYEQELAALARKYDVEDIRDKCVAALKAKVADLKLDELLLAYERVALYEELRVEVSKPMSRHLNERTCLRIASFAFEHNLAPLMTAAARFIKIHGRRIAQQLRTYDRPPKFSHQLLITILEEED